MSTLSLYTYLLYGLKSDLLLTVRTQVKFEIVIAEEHTQPIQSQSNPYISCLTAKLREDILKLSNDRVLGDPFL